MVVSWTVAVGLVFMCLLARGVSATGFQIDTESDSSLDVTPSFLLIAIGSIALWLFLASWTYKDARSRGRRGAFWFIIVILFNIVGIIVYLMTQEKRPMYLEPVADAIPLARPVSMTNEEGADLRAGRSGDSGGTFGHWDPVNEMDGPEY